MKEIPSKVLCCSFSHQFAKVNNENLSVTTEKLLLLAFEAVEEAGVSEEDIDNQHTEEENVSPFTPKEIKALRKILKKRK